MQPSSCKLNSVKREIERGPGTMSMQREREGRGEIFHSGDQFGAFRGIGSFGSRRSKFPSLFGGRDPFDDPFFTRPFGSLFESSISGPPSASSNKTETNPSKGIVIEELDDDDDDDDQGEDKAPGDDKDNRQKHSASSIEPSIEHPDDDVEEGKSKVTYEKLEGSRPQNRSYSFQTCKVTYGGIDGAYYTSSRTRRAGHDGVLIEEAKEADKTTGQATHRISRGIQDKGHSLTRKLNADGKVDTMQILHNLEEEELAGFEEAWDFNVKGHFSRSKDAFGTHGSSSSEHKGGARGNSGGWLLSHSEQVPKARGTGMEKQSGTNGGRTKKIGDWEFLKSIFRSCFQSMFSFFREYFHRFCQHIFAFLREPSTNSMRSRGRVVETGSENRNHVALV